MRRMLPVAVALVVVSAAFEGAAPMRTHAATAPNQSQSQSQSQSRAIKVRVEHFGELQDWFQRIHEHQPWQQDAAVAAVAKSSPYTLKQILWQLDMLRQLLEIAASKGIEQVGVLNVRLKTSQLAALTGLPDDELDLPYNVRDLARADSPTRIAISRLMVRAAIVHTLIAISPAETRDLQPGLPDPGPRPGLRPGETHQTVRIQDGRQVAVVNFSMHWTLARAALDLAGPPAASSEAVRLWYQATAADMQARRDYATLQPHLEYARKVLSADATTFLMSGAAYENLAAPPVQSAIAESGLTHLLIGRSNGLHGQAERHLRRALELDPKSALARLRLGRVLQLEERHADAAALLRKAESGLSNSVWQYFAALYLGRAEAALNRDEDAKAAYDRAIALFPKAQSPRLAMVEMAGRQGDQTVAISALRALFYAAEGAGAETDPWWTYDTSHVADASALWERMRAATVEAVR